MVPEDSCRAKHLTDEAPGVLMAPVSCGRAHSHCFSHGSLLLALDMLTLAPLLTDSGNMGQDLAEFLVSTLSLIPRLLREVELLRL